MNKLILGIMLALTLTVQSYGVEQDKVKHFAVSAALGAVGSQLLLNTIPEDDSRRKWAAFAFSTVIVSMGGAFYELASGHPEGGDMLANVLGAATGAGLVVAIDF